jgi:alcohol dehydrogenase class IV
MNIVTLQQPARIIFGNGCAPQCVDFLAQRGARNVLLVTSKSVRPQISSLIFALKKSGVDVLENKFVPAEPTLDFFESVLRIARLTKADSVLAIGGGSVIDVAKLLAALIQGQQTVAEVFGINLLQSRTLPLVCLPTTAGTGAEVSPNVILLDEAC